MLQKYSLGFFCDWCFVTIPSYLVEDPGDKEYKKIYIQFDYFFPMHKKTLFILITEIKPREKPALSQEIKSPGNKVDVHVFNFAIAKTFHVSCSHVDISCFHVDPCLTSRLGVTFQLFRSIWSSSAVWTQMRITEQL